MTILYRYFSLSLWGALPAYLQRKSSAIYASIYNSSFSKYFIGPYSRFQYRNKDESYLQQFEPASGAPTYKSFQDFFVRKFKSIPIPDADHSWPCEGLLFEYGKVKDLPLVNVKGQRRSLKSIFGEEGKNIPDSYYFSNIFLHNRDYHRIHAPVSGRIKRIEHIPGELVLLRPWIYPNDPSQPALRNERYNVDFLDSEGRIWYLSIVGGPAVGTIEMGANTVVGAEFNVGDEIASFLLGSTCCMAGPVPTTTAVNSQVQIGDPL